MELDKIMLIFVDQKKKSEEWTAIQTWKYTLKPLYSKLPHKNMSVNIEVRNTF